MLPLLAPVFAQLITLGVHDRTEARYLHTYEQRYEASTDPGVELSFAWPRYDFSLGYGASLTLTPLEEKPRELLVYHQASFDTSYRFRHTVLSLNSSGSFGEVNFQTQALQTATPLEPDEAGETPAGGEPTNAGQPNQPADPAQPGEPGAGQTPVPGATQPLQPRIEDRAVRYGTWSSTANVTHTPTRAVTLSASVGYTMAGALEQEDRVGYPLTRGWTAGVTATHALVLSARDGLATSLSLQQAWSSNGNRATSAVGNETYNHKFDKRLSSFVGVGVSVSRISQPNGLVAISIFPSSSVGLNYQRLLGRGTLSMSLGAFSAPVLDPLRATIDPRLGSAASISWSRDRFNTALSGAAAISTAPKDANAGAFDSYQASYAAGYQVVDWLALEAGARFAKQQYQATTTVPFSYAAFVALNLGYEIALWGGRR
jgi:hypothetical protein